MVLVISAKRLYANGTEDDGSLTSIVVDENHAFVAGKFLLDYASTQLGTTDEDDVECDAIDVTISEKYVERKA